MQPTKAITVVIVALILTGMCGYLLQPTHEEHSVTKYDYKGDLTPSVLHEQINDWEEYSPSTNVTGWRDDGKSVLVPESSVATAYIKDPRLMSYTFRSTSEVKYHDSSGISTSTPPYTEGQLFDLADRYYKQSLITYTSTYYTFKNITYSDNMIIQLDNGGTFWHRVAEPGHPDYNLHPSEYDTLLYNLNNQTVIPAVMDRYGEYLPVAGERYETLVHWSTAAYLDADTGQYVQPVLKCGTPVKSDPVFVDPTQFVSISPTGTNVYAVGEWYNKQVNGIVNIIANKYAIFLPDNLSKTLSIYDMTWYPQTTYLNGQTVNVVFGDEKGNRYVYLNMVDKTVQERYDGETNTYNLTEIPPHDVYAPQYYHFYQYTDINGQIFELREHMTEFVDLDGNVDHYELRYELYKDGVYQTRVNVAPTILPPSGLAIPQNLPYDYYLVTLDTINQTYTCKGITALTNTLNYAVADYVYPLNLLGGDIADYSEPIEALYVYAGLGVTAKVFVDSTVVAVDPSGILWGNPKMPLKYFFPEQTISDSRVLFNGFVKYGDSIVINGVGFDVVDGQIVYTHEVDFVPDTYPQIEMGIGERYEGMPLNNVIFKVKYYENMYSFPITGTVELTVSGGVTSGNLILPNGEFMFSAQLVSGNYRIVGTDATGQEYTGTVDALDPDHPVTLSKTSGKRTVTDYLPLKGMAIDFVKIPNTDKFLMKMVFTEAQDYTIDLGELRTISTTIRYTVDVYNPDTQKMDTETRTITTPLGWTVTASGNWYWQAGIYTITTTTEDNIGLDWTSGTFGLTMSGCCFLMLLFMILGSAAVFRFSEEGFTFMDWVVLGGVSILLIGVAVMG